MTKLQWRLKEYSNIFCQENAFENVDEVVPIFFLDPMYNDQTIRFITTKAMCSTIGV